eukprot:scaffold82891_cov55-Phaeocystis_antarctica.AAC.2
MRNLTETCEDPARTRQTCPQDIVGSYTHSLSPSRPPNNTLNTRQQHPGTRAHPGGCEKLNSRIWPKEKGRSPSDISRRTHHTLTLEI